MRMMTCVLGLILSVAELPAASSQSREPLPVEAVAYLNTHNGRSPIDLSPDGEWVAHTFARPETVRRDTWGYTASGVPLAEGSGRMQAALSHTRTGKMIRLGGERGSSWGAVWSPDGKRVAFYSDDEGEAGLWIWERSDGRIKRIPGFIVRPFFGFELARWLPDSRHVVCKVLPAGVSLAEANGAMLEKEGANRFKPVKPGTPSVFVLRVPPAPQADEAQAPKPSFKQVDLVLVDVQEGTATRLVQRVEVRGDGLSPDGKYLAYTTGGQHEPNSQQPNYDLMLLELSSRKTRPLAEKVRMGYGNEWSWSPDSRSIAYFTGGQLAKREIFIVSIEGGAARKLSAEGIAPLGDEGEEPPLWEASGKSILLLGAGKLWRLDVQSGRGSLAASIADRLMTELVQASGSPTAWTSRHNGKPALWAFAREARGRRGGIYRIDLATGAAQALLEEVGTRYLGQSNLDATAGEFAYVATDQLRPMDIWIFNTADGKTRQATHLNAELERYEMGPTRVIEWKADGQTRRGALLLPPSYRAGQKLPLVLWIYGGANGSTRADTFGLFNSTTFNMQVLATRGYAVLHPDAPERPGHQMQDVKEAALAAVDAAIAQGYADPDRLAVMGQSYGSYSTLAVITQSTRFKAAVITGAGGLHPDLVAGYLEMAADGSAHSIGYYEQGQGNIGGTPWTHRERYLDNSPIFLFDRIETPLLIGEGEHDSRHLGTDAVFVALKRLEKPVEYRIYENDAHVINTPVHIVDFWNRRLQFLEEHGVR